MTDKQFDPSMLDAYYGSLPQGVLWLEPVHDASGTVTDFHYAYANEALKDLLRLHGVDFRDLRISNAPSLSEETRPRILADCIQVLQTGTPSDHKIFNTRIGHHARIFRTRFHGGVLTVMQDYTEEQAAIRTLEENRQQLERQTRLANSVFDASINAAFIAKAWRNEAGAVVDFVIQRANKAFYRMLRLDEEQAIGMRLGKEFPGTVEDGALGMHLKVYHSGVPSAQDIPYSDERVKGWFHVSSVKFDDGVLVTFMDITQQRTATAQIEEQKHYLENILTHSSNGISVSEMIRDKNGRVIDARTVLANDAAIRFIGLPKEILFSKTAVTIEPNILDTPYYRMSMNTLETGEPGRIQYQLESTGRWLEITVSRLDANRLITIFSDVSAEKEAQVELERSVQELRRSNANLEEFAYVASHDLQEPLRKIGFFSERLRAVLGERLNDDGSRMLERMEAASERMRKLIDDLLAYSRVSYKPDAFEPVDLNLVVQQVLQDLEANISKTGAQIRIDPLPQIPGDEPQLRQLFQNLLGNALKYHKPESVPEIAVRYRAVNSAEQTTTNLPEGKPGRYHLIEVVDNGIGFEQEHAAKIFQVFHRLHGRSEYEGTGVGLAIVQKVVSNHGGTIVAESTPGEGATFRMLFPVK